MKRPSRQALIPIRAGQLPRKAARACARALVPIQASPFPRGTTRACAQAFTLVELLVVVAVVALLAGLILPAARNGLASARAAQCASNLRQIGVALASYAADNNNCYPPLTSASSAGIDWDQGAITNYLSLRPTGQQNIVFTCPAARFKGYSAASSSRAYTAADGLTGINPATGQVAYNYTTPRNRVSIQHPDTTVLLFDGTQSGATRYATLIAQWGMIYNTPDVKSTTTNQVYIDYRHPGQAAHFLMADGHVETIAHAQASRLTQPVWQGL